MANIWGDSGNSGWIYFFGLQNHCRWWLQPWNQKMLAPWKKSYDQPREPIKKQRHYFANNDLSSQSYGISSGHVRIWASWSIKKLSTEELMLLNCGVGEDSWDPLDCKEIKPVRPKGNQSRIFIGRTDTEAETPILWPPDVKKWLTGKDPDAEKDWRWEEKGTTEDEMVGWHDSMTWVWVNSGNWWWTGKPGVLQSVELQRAGHSWATELKWKISQHFRSSVLDVKVQRNLPVKYHGINTIQGSHKQDTLQARWKFLDKISSNILFLMLWKRAGEEELDKENKVTRLKFISCNEIGKI